MPHHAPQDTWMATANQNAILVTGLATNGAAILTQTISPVTQMPAGSGMLASRGDEKSTIATLSMPVEAKYILAQHQALWLCQFLLGISAKLVNRHGQIPLRRGPQQDHMALCHVMSRPRPCCQPTWPIQHEPWEIPLDHTYVHIQVPKGNPQHQHRAHTW